MKTSVMGVINVTPDSFSDGGQFNQEEALLAHLRFHQKHSDILDIGAESTAPMNAAIGQAKERERLELVIESLKRLEIREDLFLSLDSYRPLNVFWFFRKCLSLGFKSEQFLWNDVSGKFDEAVKDFLKDFPESRYIFCHNRAPTREQSSEHMKYVFEGEDIVEEVREALIPSAQSFKEQVICDPCFGFSKTYGANLALYEGWAQLCKDFPSWVFGVSKKSFLRRWLQENWDEGRDGPYSLENAMCQSEVLHLLWMGSILQQSSSLSEVILRVHDPKLARIACKWSLSQ